MNLFHLFPPLRRLGNAVPLPPPNVLSTFRWRLCNVISRAGHFLFCIHFRFCLVAEWPNERFEKVQEGYRERLVYWRCRWQKTLMEPVEEDNHDWPMQQRVEGYVNKHMADIALETLQQRLSVVSDEMHNLAEQVTRRSGGVLKDEPRREGVSFSVEPPPPSACSSGAGDRFMTSPSSGRPLADSHLLHSTATPEHTSNVFKWSVRVMDK